MIDEVLLLQHRFNLVVIRALEVRVHVMEHRALIVAHIKVQIPVWIVLRIEEQFVCDLAVIKASGIRSCLTLTLRGVSRYLTVLDGTHRYLTAFYETWRFSELFRVSQ